MKKFASLVILFLFTGLTAAASTSFANTISIKERVKLQRAIETVYWEHRIWPEKNTTAKPALDQILPNVAIQEKALDGLQKTKALSMFWNREITADQLQRELNRMASETKKPEMLRELWNTLGNNPYRIAELMARPVLADRLIRNAYGYDSRFHGMLKNQITEELKNHRADMRQLSGAYQELEWIQVDDHRPKSPVTTNSVELTSSEWSDWLKHLQKIFGRSSGLQSGQISTLQETDDSFFVIAILEKQNNRMKTAIVHWQKHSFDQWWKITKNSVPVELNETSYQYKLPEIGGSCAGDAWTPMRSIPDARVTHTEVWTGTELIVWGGILGPLNTGGRYDPAIDSWHPITITNEPSQRRNPTAVWTGSRMIVWGGWGGGTSDNVFNTGGLYDPLTDTWSPTGVGTNVPSPRTSHTAIWTGSEMIVWGGCPDFGCFSPLNTGGRYDPSTDTWQPTTLASAPQARASHTAVWTDTEMIIWGGANGSTQLNTGGRYDPSSDSWTATSTTNAPEGRSLHSAIWNGNEMIVWGGCGESGCFNPLNTGGRYDPTSDSWLSTSTANAPQGRRGHSAIWDGIEMIVWGGCVDHDCSSHVFTGGKYDPAIDSWTATNTSGAPSGRSFHSGVWTGSEMIVWGGCVSGECEIVTNTGGRYDPASDSWVPTSNEDAPSKRVNHSMIWTGAEMVVWGGFSFLPVFTGGIYDPATDHWTNISLFSNTPGARDGHTAVWTGTEMIIWGGREFGIGVTASGARCDLSTQSCVETTFTNAPAARAFHTALWSGTEMIVWGGCATEGCDQYLNSGGRYDPASDSWTTITQTNAPPARFAHSAIFTGSEMIVWGGFPATNTGGRYDLAADSWQSTSLTGAPTSRYRHTGIWDGIEMIIWGGFDGTNLFGDGARYNPAADSWTAVSNTSAPAPRWEHTAVWTDSEMIIWGGCADGPCTDHHLTGGRYNPVSDSWAATNSTEFVPFARALHTAVWSGSEMLIWGGWQDFSSEMTNTGARYCTTPATPDFTISCNPSSWITLPGSDVTSTCTITSFGGFNDAVDLTCNNLPSNVTCTFNPPSVTPPPNGSIDSMLTVTVGGSVPDGDYEFDVVGTSGVLSHSFAVDLTVTSVCNYAIDPTSATYDASGGSGTVDVTALTGCAWTAVSNDSWITVTGGASGNGNGTVDYTVDPNPDQNQRIGTITIAGQTFTVTQTGVGCVFCDDFEDGVLDPNWNYLKPAWSESGGFLIGTPIRRKAITIASPAFAGCDTCSVEALMRTAGGIGNRVWVYGWYIDKANTIELMMKEESDKWVFRQRSGGQIVARAKASLTIDPNVDYKVEIQFDGTNFQVSIDDVLIFTIPKATGTTPFGTVGFATKSTTGSFGEINVN